MRKILLLVATSVFTLVANAQVVINEFMQSNIDCIMDDLNDFPDSWVEIYNGTSASINLANYKLGDSDKPEKAYQLPPRYVAPNGYAIIYCDKVGSGLHTDFRLDSGKGGAIYLFEGSTAIDQITGIKKQPAPNIAYGRKVDGDSSMGYMSVPTPGAANCGKTCKDILPAPEFSVAGGVYSEGSTKRLVLKVPEGAPEGTVIRYTTDGSEPTLSNGTTYASAIIIQSTKIVRATLFCDGYLSPRSTVQSYIFMNRSQTLPVISISTDNKYLNDSKIGIYVTGNYESNVPNYKHDWRRPINIEMYEKDNTIPALNQLCEMRIQGGESRNQTLKSLALYANKRFGEKRFAYEFFPDQRPGQTNYKSFILRNAGNDFDYLYMRDAIMQRSMAQYVDMDWQAWSPAIIYINGVYKGILNIRERSNDDNIFTNYDELEDIDLVENTELKNGTMDNFNAFKAFYNEHGHTMAEYANYLDVEEFINVYVMNIFYNNQDWPGNNTAWWRPTAEGGRWRIIAKDTDFGLGLYGSSVSYNTIEWLYNNGYDPDRAWGNSYDATRLFRRLMEDDDFKREFTDHCAVYSSDILKYDQVWKIWGPMYNKIKTEYPVHRKLYNEWWPNYAQELSNAQNWLRNRHNYFLPMLKKYYGLGNIINVEVAFPGMSSSDIQRLQGNINNINLANANYNGKFFEGHTFTLTCTPKTADELAAQGISGEPYDKVVASWEVNVDGTVTTYPGATVSVTIPNATKVTFTPKFELPTGIDNVSAENSGEATSPVYYDLQGRVSKGSRPSGIYLERTQNGARKVMIK